MKVSDKCPRSAQHRLKFQWVYRAICLFPIIFSSLCIPVSYAAPKKPVDKTTLILQQYRELSHRAEQANDQYIAAVERSTKLKREVSNTQIALKNTAIEGILIQRQMNRLHSSVNVFVNSLYKGARISRFFVLVLSKTPQLTLDQLTIEELMGRTFNQKISQFLHDQASLKILEIKYTDQIIQARKSEIAAAHAIQVAESRGLILKLQAARIRAMYNHMTGQELAALRGPTYTFNRNLLPKHASGAILAVDAALSRIGAPYVWGGVGPHDFDCSGLMLWAYAQAGKTIPRTSQAQYRAGVPIKRNQLKPGDLVIIYPDASHVAMYIGDGFVIHASDFGIPVKIVPLDSAGPILAYRRFPFS